MSDRLQLFLSSVGPIAGPEPTQPIADELARLYNAPIDVHVLDREPPAAGFTEIALVASVTGAVGLLYKFFEPLLTTAGEAFRDRVLDLDREGTKNKETGRKYFPLRIKLGSDPVTGQYPNTPVRYQFHGRIDADELLLRLEAADKHVRTLPEQLFSGPGGPPEIAFFWDKDQQRWRGSVWLGGYDDLYGEDWLPSNLWEE